MAFKEKATRAVEQLAEMYRSRGDVEARLAAAGERTRNVVATVNGPLMQAMAKATYYTEPAVVEMLQKGAPLLGSIQASPDCKEGNYEEARYPELLKSECKERNLKLLESLWRDKHENFLEK